MAIIHSPQSVATPKMLTKNTGSDNICYGDLAVLESRSGLNWRDCAGCGHRFLPTGPQRYCDHSCYAQSLRVDITARYWPKVKIAGPDDCWLWIAKARIGYNKTFPGYGSIIGFRNGKKQPLYAHRVAWELTYGPIPDGLSVLHRCDVSLCCNPAHLFLGTQTDNMRDAFQKGRLTGRPVSVTNVEPVRFVMLPVRGWLHAGHSTDSLTSTVTPEISNPQEAL